MLNEIKGGLMKMSNQVENVSKEKKKWFKKKPNGNSGVEKYNNWTIHYRARQ